MARRRSCDVCRSSDATTHEEEIFYLFVYRIPEVTRTKNRLRIVVSAKWKTFPFPENVWYRFCRKLTKRWNVNILQWPVISSEWSSSQTANAFKPLFKLCSIHSSQLAVRMNVDLPSGWKKKNFLCLRCMTPWSRDKYRIELRPAIKPHKRIRLALRKLEEGRRCSLVEEKLALNHHSGNTIVSIVRNRL